MRTCDYSSKITEQTGHALDTEIVEVFPPVAEDNTEYDIESYSSLKFFVDVINTLLNTNVILWLSPQSSNLQKK